MVDLSVTIGSGPRGITLKNPIMPASGAFSTDVAQVVDVNRLGALVAKTVSREFRAGNPVPRVAELECGMINSIGLPTKGIEYFVEHQVPDYKRFTPPLVASISAVTADDFEAMTRDVSLPDVAVIEVNISCPTRAPGGGNFALHSDHTYNVTKRIREATDKPVWVKLSPNAGDVVEIAQAAEQGGADALVVANTILGLKINTETFRPAIGNKFGGISGPGIKPIIVRMVHQVSQGVKIPVIGCGGITKVEDVVEYMLAGASAVMIGYLIFRNPSALTGIIDDLEAWCDRRGFKRVRDLTGAMINEKLDETYHAASLPIGQNHKTFVPAAE
jgi:dihydroorotate dehydrogenase (NAD+) catalytic subunit